MAVPVLALNYEGEDFCQDSPAWPDGTYLGQMHPYHSDFYRGYAERRGWDPCATWATDQRNSAIRGLRELGYTVQESRVVAPFNLTDPFTATLLWVHDGDTLNVDRYGAREAIRLHNVSAEELGKAGGDSAKRALEDLVGEPGNTLRVLPCYQFKAREPGKGVIFETRAQGRLVAQVFVDGASVNDAMVAAGYSGDGIGADKDFGECRPAKAVPTATPAAQPSALDLYDDNGNGRISCAEARAHGIAPVRRGHPAYEYMNDPDGDGVVCE